MRLRLILAFVCIVLVTLASVIIISRYSTASQVRNFMYRGGMTGMDGLVDALETYYSDNRSWADVETVFASPHHGMGGGQGMMSGNTGNSMMNQRLILLDDQGAILFDSQQAQPSGQVSSTVLESAIPLQYQARIVGYLLTEGGVNISPLSESNLLTRLNRTVILAAAVAGSIALLVALAVAYRLMRPVSELNYAAKQLAHGDLSQRVPVRGEDELSELGRAFNQMAESLEQAEENRRAMTSDIAHELRTPLAIQRANLEALQDGIYSLTPENLQPVIDQNLTLTRLVEDLRTLALADAGELTFERLQTDFQALVQQIVERFQPQAQTKRIDLVVNKSPLEPPPSAFIDPLRVEQILNNLLANALRHTPQDGRIILDLTFQNNYAQLSVHDSGPGIPNEALPHVFERFYRGDKSRSRSEGGSGLGLAIARQLAESHGGLLTANNHPQGGAVFTLQLPLHPK